MSPSQTDGKFIQPDISRITIAPELLLECVRRWEMQGFKGSPPHPAEIAYESEEQGEVVIMANFVYFRKNKPKRDDSKRDGIRLEDI